MVCGSSSTAYIETEKYVGGNMNLATAMAISGAAVDANTYATRSRPLSHYMKSAKNDLCIRIRDELSRSSNVGLAWGRLCFYAFILLFNEILSYV